ncbi:MAG TPA: hypothetical protein VLX09_10070 [Stellaceae bacterium]|nr:hypothetical protein [Stellaceae bacterium]
MPLWRGLAAMLFIVAWAVPALACPNLADAPSSRWQLDRTEGHAWLVSPCGQRVFTLGVNVMDPGFIDPSLERDAYSRAPVEPRLAQWIDAARKNVTEWGFNTAGGFSIAPDLLRMPTVINLELGRNSRFHWFDPFDPKMPAIMRDKARELVAPYRGSPYRIGYFSDNEVGWWGGALFRWYSAAAPNFHTKARLVSLLRSYYRDNWKRFTADFAPPAGVNSWRQLLSAREVTHLRPGGNGIAVVRRWTFMVAEHYYKLSRDAIHAADPQALYLGDRLPIYYDPMAVRAGTPYVDLISTNYNVDSPEGWIAPYYFAGLHALSGGKPVLVSEWFYAARENRTGNRNNGHLMTVATQEARADGAAVATRAFARLRDVVGLHWFQYYDDPRGGRKDGEDYDFGLVDAQGEPYRRLTEALTAANAAVPAIHATTAATTALGSAGPFVIPKAAIDPDEPSFIDWPKPASLLPPLIAEPGEVAFGEAYLSWSAVGLALGTIGQDYYDIGLLGYDGDFPLSEAYRVELHVDAGAGPRHFTYYFIPPRTKVKDHPPMAPKLCLGTPAEHGPTECTPVPGAKALYFGADQPRIAAEAIIPWEALGLSGPPADGSLKVEVSSTAWYRSRWMSLSGLSPAEAAKHPERWRRMELGGLRTAG